MMLSRAALKNLAFIYASFIREDIFTLHKEKVFIRVYTSSRKLKMQKHMKSVSQAKLPYFEGIFKL